MSSYRPIRIDHDHWGVVKMDTPAGTDPVSGEKKHYISLIQMNLSRYHAVLLADAMSAREEEIRSRREAS